MEKVQQERKEVGGYASSVNLTDPCRMAYSTVLVEGCQAGGLGHLLHYLREYNAESPKQGRKGFNSIVKTIYVLFLSSYYLSMITHESSQLLCLNLRNFLAHFLHRLESSLLQCIFPLYFFCICGGRPQHRSVGNRDGRPQHHPVGDRGGRP